jgi:hypothetical protein
MPPPRSSCASSMAAYTAAPALMPTNKTGLPRQPPRHRPRILRRHAQEAVGQPGVVDARHDRRLQVLQPFDHRQLIFRLHGDQLDVGVALLEIAPRTHEGAGRAQPGHKMRDAAAVCRQISGPVVA